MTRADGDAAKDAFRQAIADGQPVRMFADITHYEGFDLSLLRDHDLSALKNELRDKLDRCAIVGAPGWLEAGVKALDALAHVEIRCFDADQGEVAWQWLNAGRPSVINIAG